MRRSASIAIFVLIALAACSSEDDADRAEPTTQVDGSAPEFPPPIDPYRPHIDPADFSATVDNQYFRLTPGTTMVYRGRSEDGIETVVVKVTGKTRLVMGVECVVVRDVASVDGEVVEKTYDWYAQDRYGNVWYFGEDTAEYENGRITSRHGAWEAGVDGALPGILMLGSPQVGDRYRQEFYAGEAEDMAEVLRLDAGVAVPYGKFENVLATKDWTPLEPDILEHKYYARGVGVVMEEAVKGGPEVLRLVEVRG